MKKRISKRIIGKRGVNPLVLIALLIALLIAPFILGGLLVGTTFMTALISTTTYWAGNIVQDLAGITDPAVEAVEESGVLESSSGCDCYFEANYDGKTQGLYFKEGELLCSTPFGAGAIDILGTMNVPGNQNREVHRCKAKEKQGGLGIIPHGRGMWEVLSKGVTAGCGPKSSEWRPLTFDEAGGECCCLTNGEGCFPLYEGVSCDPSFMYSASGWFNSNQFEQIACKDIPGEYPNVQPYRTSIDQCTDDAGLLPTPGDDECEDQEDGTECAIITQADPEDTEDLGKPAGACFNEICIIPAECVIPDGDNGFKIDCDNEKCLDYCDSRTPEGSRPDASPDGEDCDATPAQSTETTYLTCSGEWQGPITYKVDKELNGNDLENLFCRCYDPSTNPIRSKNKNIKEDIRLPLSACCYAKLDSASRTGPHYDWHTFRNELCAEEGVRNPDSSNYYSLEDLNRDLGEWGASIEIDEDCSTSDDRSAPEDEFTCNGKGLDCVSAEDGCDDGWTEDDSGLTCEGENEICCVEDEEVDDGSIKFEVGKTQIHFDLEFKLTEVGDTFCMFDVTNKEQITANLRPTENGPKYYEDKLKITFSKSTEDESCNVLIEEIESEE